MIKYRFKYVRFDSFFRPVIPITLKHNNKSFDYLALIDSGAEFNIFHADLTQILGIDLSLIKNTFEFSGIRKGSQGQGKGFLTALEIGIQNSFFDSPVVFSYDISDRGYGILGQLGFFDHFKIKMDYKAKSIQLKTNS